MKTEQIDEPFQRIAYYTPEQQQRLNRLPFSARWILQEVIAVMQNAEELEGPEGDAYLALMQAIIDEATERLCYFAMVA